MNDNKNQLREDAIEFAIQISDLCDEIKGCSVYVNQIVRSSSSIGANIHEANYAASKADFINKFHIALKECGETEYWIEMLVGSWFKCYKRRSFKKTTAIMRHYSMYACEVHHYRKEQRLRTNVHFERNSKVCFTAV